MSAGSATDKAAQVRQAFWRREYERAVANGDRELKNLAQRFMDEYDELLALSRMMGTDEDVQSLDRG